MLKHQIVSRYSRDSELKRRRALVLRDVRIFAWCSPQLGAWDGSQQPVSSPVFSLYEILVCSGFLLGAWYRSQQPVFLSCVFCVWQNQHITSRWAQIVVGSLSTVKLWPDCCQPSNCRQIVVHRQTVFHHHQSSTVRLCSAVRLFNCQTVHHQITSAQSLHCVKIFIIIQS